MIFYHGSFLEIVKPDLVHSRPNVDFGRGFYVTPLYEQAAKWCGKFKRRGKAGIISRYEYDESREAELKALKFDSYSEKWLDFILNCRSGKDSTDYDLVVTRTPGGYARSMAVCRQCSKENSTMNHWGRQLKDSVKKMRKVILTISYSVFVVLKSPVSKLMSDHCRAATSPILIPVINKSQYEMKR